jgi:methyltransferase (TIGR00027 family)
VQRDRASVTAAFVAACRGLGVYLPRDARLIHDPHGLRYAGPVGRALALLARMAGVRPLQRSLLYMQVRTRLIDDALLGFLRGGGRQVLILGAGFDARAARFARQLADAGAVVYEVDHPATQARKHADTGRVPGVAYLPWDFEARPVAGLPAALAAAGHDPAVATLTIWEGVTMYLTAPAIEATVAAVAALSAPGSQLALTYFERALIERPPRRGRLAAALARRAGEPFRFGWDPDELPAWLEARGFTLEWDRPVSDAARELLPPSYAAMLEERGRRVALAGHR